MKDIGADLSAPGSHFIGFKRLNGALFLFLLDLPKFSSQKLEGIFSILLLIALGLTGHGDPSWFVSQAHGSGHFIDILTAMATSAEKLPFQIFFSDLHIFFLDHREHLNQSKGSLAQLVCIKR